MKGTNSSGLAARKKGTFTAIRSVEVPSGSWKVIAIPRIGTALSGASGTPPELEKRMTIGTGVDCRCAATLSAAASREGVKVPLNSAPLAWITRRPG